MTTRYNQKRINALSERGHRMAKARWKADRLRRDEEEPERLREMEEIHRQNLPKAEGDFLGTLQWTDARSGRVRRWVVRVGNRADRITLEAPGGKKTRSHGWTWALERLRKHLAR